MRSATKTTLGVELSPPSGWSSQDCAGLRLRGARRIELRLRSLEGLQGLPLSPSRHLRIADDNARFKAGTQYRDLLEAFVF